MRAKVRRVKKGVFAVRKGSCTTSNIVKIRKIWEKKGKIRKTWSMTKKKVIRNFCHENGNFVPQKTAICNLDPAKNFSVSPNSTPGLRHCLILHLVY